MFLFLCRKSLVSKEGREIDTITLRRMDTGMDTNFKDLNVDWIGVGVDNESTFWHGGIGRGGTG